LTEFANISSYINVINKNIVARKVLLG